MFLLRPIQPIAGCSKIIRPISRQSRGRLRLPVRQASTRTTPYEINGKTYPIDSYSNVPPTILSKLDRNLHLVPSHPISILRSIIESHFSTFSPVTPSSPILTVTQNFDELGFTPDHPGRALSDSYYLNKEYVLRTHTSAHEIETYQKGLNQWLLTADVYRRDEIDSSHYPVFHQMEGASVWPSSELSRLPQLNAELERRLAECPLVIDDTSKISLSNPYQEVHDPENAAQIAQHLKHSLNSLIFRLFGPIATKGGEPLRIRWIDAYFPFTSPSYEVEVWWNGDWLELLGCGVMQQPLLNRAGEWYPCVTTARSPSVVFSADRSLRCSGQIWMGIWSRPRAALHGPLLHPRYPALLVKRSSVSLPVHLGTNNDIQAVLQVSTSTARHVVLDS